MASRARQKLSALEVKQLAVQPGLHNDGGGLCLQCDKKSHIASWIFRFALYGRKRSMGLGRYPDVSLAEAREAAAAARKLLLDKIDPLEARRAARLQQRLKQAQMMTFKAAVEAYKQAHQDGWRPNTRKAWEWSFPKFVYPKFGDVPVSLIDTPLVLQILDPIWLVKARTADQLRSRIGMVLDWAVVRGYREGGPNPTRWRGHLDKTLMEQSKAMQVAREKRGRTNPHRPALSYLEIPSFLVELRQSPSPNHSPGRVKGVTGAE